MGAAVVQIGPKSPSFEQLERAFQQAPGLAAFDIQTLGRDAYGILVKGLDLAQADAIHSSLAAEGIDTHVIQDAELPELPPPRFLRKVEYSDKALLIDDMGRTVALPWNDIAIIAAGCVPLVEFTTELEEKIVAQRHGRGVSIKVVPVAETKEEKKERLLLELVTRGCDRRCQFEPDKPEALLLFQCLGERRTHDALQNLSLFVNDLAVFAPGAVLNYGADRLSRSTNDPFIYGSKTAFYREITWLLWTLSNGAADNEPANRPDPQ